MKKEELLKQKKIMVRSRKVLFLLMILLRCTMVYADGDPLTVINNLSNLIFGLIRAVGIILTGMGIMQFGLALKSHDPSQRANSFLTIVGGVVIAFSKEILNSIIG